jgi:SAM-dependent methyltransferase
VPEHAPANGPRPPAEPAIAASRDLLLQHVLHVASAASSGAVLVDLGAGRGALAAALAGDATTVTAVESSRPQLKWLRAVAASYPNVAVSATDLVGFDLPPGSVDLVVSGRALHRLHDADKRRIVRSCHRWLRPGGLLVVGDDMFARGPAELWRRVAVVVGPSGATEARAWPRRVAVTAQALLRLGSVQPAPVDFWVRALRDAGFRDVASGTAGPGSGVVWGTKTTSVTPD